MNAIRDNYLKKENTWNVTKKIDFSSSRKFSAVSFENEGSYKIDWGDGTIDSEKNHKYEIAGTYNVKIYGSSTGIMSKSKYVNKIVVFTDITISCKENTGIEEFESHNLTSVSAQAFFGCSKLSKVSFDDKLKTIEFEAFDLCNLSRVAIPGSVTLIEDKAFEENSSLSIVDLTSFTDPNAIPTLGPGVFSSCSPYLKFYVSSVTMKEAFNTSWSAYSGKFTTDPVPSL